MTTTTAQTAIYTGTELLPDLDPERYVHGIKSLEPPIVQCDGCGKTHSESKLSLTILLSHIVFNPRTPADSHRRMCGDCWLEAGWRFSPSEGWTHVGGVA